MDTWETIPKEDRNWLQKCNERINKIYASQGDKISMSQIKRILGVPVYNYDERLIFEKGVWRRIGA